MKKQITQKNEILQLGITGGIGTGKSTVCKIFETLGIAVYDADIRAKMVMVTDNILKKELKKAFGEEVYLSENEINRDYLVKTVFSNQTDNSKVEILNSIVHPAVGRDYQNWYNENKDKSPYLLKEAALMFESDSYKVLDAIIVVHAPLEERIKRVLKRDSHRTEEQVKAIISKQMPENEKLKRADFVIYNDGSHSLIEQVLKLHEKFQSLS
ncbi:dephospho-CoA kinase [Bernardetia litoralis DSM 6794]|uniref:Dephospho-CoA kinase n=1 Tax=Bernardetia litoralis (strain ATCC 23117 / DSM 6794 / NBRC 15988 / NCIMB 1366 / Fx l1 / Sio-4) TaxID=880071 RepID=I4AJR0_BERLS|nr:dephospho-CoA kinase [Bernardetia litoralis]AFM04195.1 dephospho-CoA kinase [Bernardetia litoralis DSM 6794]